MVVLLTRTFGSREKVRRTDKVSGLFESQLRVALLRASGHCRILQPRLNPSPGLNTVVQYVVSQAMETGNRRLEGRAEKFARPAESDACARLAFLHERPQATHQSRQTFRRGSGQKVLRLPADFFFPPSHCSAFKGSHSKLTHSGSESHDSLHTNSSFGRKSPDHPTLSRLHWTEN
jgi:hypothetical protein